MSLDEKVIHGILEKIMKEHQMKERDAILKLTQFRIDKNGAKDILKKCEEEGRIKRRRGRIYITDNVRF